MDKMSKESFVLLVLFTFTFSWASFIAGKARAREEVVDDCNKLSKTFINHTVIYCATEMDMLKLKNKRKIKP